MQKVRISSLDDPRLEPYRQLKDTNRTRWAGLFICEGEKLVRRLLASEFSVESVLLSNRFEQQFETIARPDLPVWIVPDELVEPLVGFNFHRGILGDPLAVAAALGGRELAAIAGAVLAARQHKVPVLLDGFVATSAVLPLARLDAGALDHCRAGHVSVESGHRDLLRERKLPPLLDLNMRLGEASGGSDPAGARRAGLPRRDGNFHGGRRLRHGRLTKPCHISQRNWLGGQC